MENKVVRQLISNIISLRVGIKQFYFQRVKELDLDLTYEMVQVLAVLWREGELNQQDIADAVQKSKASITPLIDNLCKRELVERIPDPNDRRNNKITVTAKGFAYQAKVEPIQQEFLDKIIQDISMDEIKELNNSLVKIRKALY
ncbi:MarR family winged helix-turn-helix transcriptional regulator [Sphingobacterium lactis]|uniref:DNA-binding transcriptional regulator, MarR family n=1 Tax=Sphingobacterium lactis TaxID=797291 RepID=A0A1H5YMU2_9SPHI|nr:MarR family transcriptional regulator [Sphingobacterium lactis]SEG25479.1 DNA-binding transcriptional regulator, MarR family [Sphingobacterium lactis]